MESTEFDEVLATVAALVEEVVVPAEDEIESTDAIPEHVRRAAAMV